MNPEQNPVPSQPINENGATNPPQPSESEAPAPQPEVTPQVVVSSVDPVPPQGSSPAPSSPTPQVQGAAPMGAPDQVSAKKKVSPKLLIVIAIVVVVIVAGVVVLLVSSKNKNSNSTQNTTGNPAAAAANVSNQYISDLKSDKAADAYNLLSPSYKKTVTESEFAQVFNAIASGAKDVKFKLAYDSLSQRSHPQRVITAYEVLSSGSGYFGFLIQNNNPWQIIGVQVTNSLANAKQVTPASSN